MQSPLQRLYRTKLVLLAVASTAVGIALMVFARWPGLTVATWILGLATDFGGVLLTTGLVVLAFEYVVCRDDELRSHEELRQLLHEEAPAFRDAVVEGFAFEPESLTNVASPETLDRVIENSLAIRLGDAELARDAYADLREQVVRAPERWRDAQVSIALARSPHDGMFVATVRCEYRSILSSPVQRFACVSDMDEYRELLQDPSCAALWYFESIAGLDGASPEAFELVQITVDGKPLKSRRTAKRGSQVFTVNLGTELIASRQEVAVAYTYRVLVQQHGHLVHLDVARPTKGFKATLWYGDCGIRYVNVLDYIAGVEQPRISRLKASVPTPSVEVAYDGWIFPKGGVGFVWVLEEEMRRVSEDPTQP
jgi:hypothetical protein